MVPELLDMLLKGLIGEEVVPLASLKHDPDVPVAVLEAVAMPAAFCAHTLREFWAIVNDSTIDIFLLRT